MWHIVAFRIKKSFNFCNKKYRSVFKKLKLIPALQIWKVREKNWLHHNEAGQKRQWKSCVSFSLFSIITSINKKNENWKFWFFQNNSKIKNNFGNLFLPFQCSPNCATFSPFNRLCISCSLQDPHAVHSYLGHSV